MALNCHTVTPSPPAKSVSINTTESLVARDNGLVRVIESQTEPRSPKQSKMAMKPSWDKPEINIILIGETGVGKTSMLNLLANVCAGVELDEFRETHFISNEQGGSQAGSQTNKPCFYVILCANGKVVKILDTPGLADTCGMDKDNEHKQAIIASAIKEKFEVIDAILILANGTIPRLGNATESALTVISSMFPNSIIENTAFVFTMVTDPLSFNFEKSSLQPERLQSVSMWSINNPLAQWKKYQEKLRSKEDYDEGILEDTEISVRSSYKKTLKTLSQIFQFLDKCKAQPTDDIHIMSTGIEATNSNTIARTDWTKEKCARLQALRVTKDTQDQVQKINEIIIYEQEGAGNQHNTMCGNCEENCKVGFILYNSTGNGLQRRCIACRHLAKDHQHYNLLKRDKKTEDDKRTVEDSQSATTTTRRRRKQKKLRYLWWALRWKFKGWKRT
ncbi:hypothetical protein GYMLUDRAFT_77679 [Collybiopsis luxurians FD-317 M1]|uniref:AIG1-type G domain-containing protein n=1 Tax=Collybiopsis luxurians FD-317 M1 TaxID=944289 RepID=A0A0D0BE40_9AGAR|nr:hypothetical protein GYMLUDRAFT_77679 [Collybiopsis luxurians FD-317 M1]